MNVATCVNKNKRVDFLFLCFLDDAVCFYRYTVKMLLNHEFFAEGFKIETLPQQVGESEDSPILHLRILVPTKETSKKNNQESIEFSYDIDKDQPEVVVAKMVSSPLLILPIFQHSLPLSPLSSSG